MRALSPEYLRRRHSTKWNLACTMREIRITRGVGDGDEHGAEARQESATAETGGGAEATGRDIGGKSARARAPGGPCAHSTLLSHRIRVRRWHGDAGSGARRHAPSRRVKFVSDRHVLSRHQECDV